jgi:hypothetical protein
MKLLCSASNLGYMASLKIALDAEGIETYHSDADRVMGGIAGPMGSVGRLYLLDDNDLEAAREVMRSLESTDAVAVAPASTSAMSRRRPLPRWLMVGGMMLAVALFGLILANSM